MKIALLTLSFLPARGGMEYVVHDLATALHNQGHDVTVFAPRPRTMTEEVEHSYRLVRFGWTFRGAFRFGINRWPLRREFGRLHNESPFDVINSHSAYLATTYGLFLKRRFGVPVVVTCHGHDIQRYPEIGYGLRLDPKKDRVIRANLDNSDLSVSISASTDKDLGEVLPDDKIVSIPNGINIESDDQTTTPWLRQCLDAKSDLIVLSVGRNVSKKSFGVGLEAFAVAVRENPSLRYVHIGRDEQPLREQAERLGIADRFDALGEQPRHLVLQAYREADIFFSPAAVESFGIVTYEAMAAGLPSLVSDGPGNRDAIVNGETGIIAPVNDVGHFAAGLVELASNDELRQDFGETAVREVARYSWPRVAVEYVEAFSSLLPVGIGDR